MDIVSTDGIPEKEFLAIALAIESRSEYSLAEAIGKYAKERGAEISNISAFEAVTGKGTKAVIQGKTYKIGNFRFFTKQAIYVKSVEDEVSCLQ
jgi:cation transport ATPase